MIHSLLMGFITVIFTLILIKINPDLGFLFYFLEYGKLVTKWIIFFDYKKEDVMSRFIVKDDDGLVRVDKTLDLYREISSSTILFMNIYGLFLIFHATQIMFEVPTYYDVTGHQYRVNQETINQVNSLRQSARNIAILIVIGINSYFMQIKSPRAEKALKVFVKKIEQEQENDKQS